jgi:hypothetical protein
MNLIWDHLLPAMKEAPLPADKVSQSELNQNLSSLALLPPKGRASSPVAARVSGRVFQLEANALGAGAVSFGFQEDSCVFNLNDGKASHPIACGLGKWVDGQTDMPGTPPKLTSGSLGPISKVAAGGLWKDRNTFEMMWRFYETPHHDTVTCRFDGDRVRITFMNSVTENMPPHPETRPTLLGQMTTLAPKWDRAARRPAAFLPFIWRPFLVSSSRLTHAETHRHPFCVDHRRRTDRDRPGV